MPPYTHENCSHFVTIAIIMDVATMILCLVEERKRGTWWWCSTNQILFERIKYASNCTYCHLKTRKWTEATAACVLACIIKQYINHPLAANKTNVNEHLVIHYYIFYYYLEYWNRRALIMKFPFEKKNTVERISRQARSTFHARSLIWSGCRPYKHWNSTHSFLLRSYYTTPL
jgi:hypothetical protein